MTPEPIAARLRSLPVETIQGRKVPVAVGLRARLLGLAGLRREEVGVGLLIPRCSSVHTCGMRFALDLVFLDAGRRVLAVRCGVSPFRVVSFRAADAVLEVPAGQGGEFHWRGD
ncbi:MAG TPA: DUF192 domain-containing protein [Solirubrobacterales bacterium]